ncbi:glyoxalase [Marinobacter sp. KM021]|uniref:glyoxalase n=1 Tax=Marinobacter sp. KM021 TaxID=3075616 RepID=UPI003D6B2225
MKVKRIVSNIAAVSPSEADKFYSAIFGLTVVMDHGWIRTYSSGEEMTTQISVASEGGSGTAVPDLSIEVDCLDAALERVKSENIGIE